VRHPNHGQSLHTDRIPEAGDQDLAVKEVAGVHMRLVEVCLASGGHVDNQDLTDITRSNTIDMQPGGHVYVDILDQAYKTHACNRDIRHDVLSGGRKGIHLRQSNIRTLRTTNIPAYAASCIHEEIHKHRPFCTSHGASAYKQSPNALAREDGWVVVSEAESSTAKVMYASADSAGGQEDILQGSEQVYIFGHLCRA
jgi:hypothetical protein